MLNCLFRYFEGLTQPFPETENLQTETPPSRLRDFFHFHLRGYYKPLIGLAVLNVIFAIMEVSLFGFMGQIVDWLGQHDKDTLLQNEGWTLLGMAFVLLVLLPLTGALGGLLNYQSLMANFPMAVRWRSHRYLLGQSMAFYQDEFAGRVATKVMQTSLSVRATVVTMIDVMVYVVVYFLSALVLLWELSFWLMLPMLVWLFLYIGIQRWFLPQLMALSQNQADARSLMTGRIVDAYTNMATVKLFAHTQKEADYAKDSMQDFLGTVHRQMRCVNLFILSVEMLNYILIFVVSAVGIMLWAKGLVTAGAVAVAVAMALRLNGISHWVMFEVGNIFENLGTVMDGIKSLSKTHTVTDMPDAKPLAVTGGAIRFENVRFSYGSEKTADNAVNSEKNSDSEPTLAVLKDLSLHIKAGERIGLVGRSGAGKSTLVSALLRFYDVESGKILIDEQNIAKVTQDSLRANIAMVTQDTSLLHRSVRENILYGRPDADEAALQQAITQAKADEFITQLTDPDGNVGLDAQVGERGVKLSGGQRQRIAIARVLLKNAPILILDEATSALDSEVEAAIQESLDNLMQDKTVIAIAHRLSTIAAMDRLVIVDDGEIIEQGTHDELLAKNGVYAKLWAHQTGGFLGEK